MKKSQNWLAPICVILLFTMCKKDYKLPDNGADNIMHGLTGTTPVYEWRFDTNGNFEGWTVGNATATVSGGTLNLTTTGTDPLTTSPDNLNINAPATFKFVQVAMNNNTSVTSGRIFFITNTDTVWTSAKSKGFTIKANTNTSYIVDMSTVAGWTGTIRRIRFDPLDPATGSGQTVNIDLISVVQAATNINEWRFDTDGNMEGWTAGNATPVVLGGTLNLTTTGNDPLIMSPVNLNITAPATYKFIHVDIKNYSTVTSARIFFITDTDSTWSSAKSKSFTIKADSNYYASYIVDMSTVAGWSGTIKQIRIDPLDPASGSGQKVSIDFIRITDNRSFRGVMSPQSDLTAGDVDTLKYTWKANVMRWQINSPTGIPATVAAYDAWLDLEIAQLDNAFNLCEPVGIKLLIDLHYTPLGYDKTKGTMIFYDQAANDKLVASWQKLATRYKDRTGLYGYDLMNEPILTAAPLAGDDFRSTVIKTGNAIRAIDRKTPIFVAAPVGDNPAGFPTLTPMPFTNVVYEVHMYEPHEYTQQQIPGSGYDTAHTYPGLVKGVMTDKARLISYLEAVRTFQTNYSTRIFVGEFSAVRWAGGAPAYLRDCIDIFESYSWSWAYHAYRESTYWSLEYASQVSEVRQITPPTDRYNQVVGWGLNLNQ